MEHPKDAVMAMERRRCAAIAEGNVEALGTLMADDLVHVHGNGVVHDKAGLIAYLTGSHRRVEREKLEVRILEDIAIMTGYLINHVTQKDGSISISRLVATQVLRRNGDDWTFTLFYGRVT